MPFTLLGAPQTDNLQIQMKIPKNFVVIDFLMTALDPSKGSLLSIVYNELGLPAEMGIHQVLKSAQLAMDVLHRIDLAVAEAVF